MKRVLLVLMALTLSINVSFVFAEAQPAEEQNTLFGSPWVNSMIIGNLPEKAPSVKDDLYLSMNYDELAAHQEEVYIPAITSSRLRPSVTELIHDESFNVSGMLPLRIFWKQASDDDALRREGLSAVMPYINRIMAADSVQALNEILLDDDFPFSPWLFLTVAPESLRGNNIVCILPALALSDDPLRAMDAYEAQVSTMMDLMPKMSALNLASKADPVLRMLDGDTEDTSEQMISLFNAEASYVSLYPNTAKLTGAEYGTIARYSETLTDEELPALCHSFPLKETLKKFGKDASPAFSIGTKEWLIALDGLWKDENLALLKTLTAYKVLLECSTYVSQDVFNEYTMTPLSGEGNAWNVCDKAPTFSILLAQLYAENCLGSDVRDRLTEVTTELLDEFRTLLSETDWLSEASRADAIEKVDQIHLNILGPENGYPDFSGLQLKTTAEGGTLLSNYLTLKAYRNKLENQMIGQSAVTDMYWRASAPSTVNCFYDPSTNSINVLPAFISPANWWEGISEMQILGGVGTVISHELGHAFDSFGSQINAYGEPVAILHGDDLQEFLKRVDRITDYYNAIIVLPETPLPGEKLRSENAADLVGLKAAVSLAASKKGADLAAFFRMYASLYIQTIDEFSYMMMFMTDTHAPNYLRVNVNCQMMPEYAETFSVEEGNGMYVKPEDRLTIWGK